MNRYEQLCSKNTDIKINDTHLLPGRFKGFYTDGVILLDKSLSSTSKVELLAEEVAHYRITKGNIIDVSNPLNFKFENSAKRLSKEILIPLSDLVEVLLNGVSNIYDFADYFGITSECAEKCITHYQQKYGLFTTYKNYRITFEPLSIESIKPN